MPFPANLAKKQKKEKIKPGDHKVITRSVEPEPGYVPGDAVRIYYDVHVSDDKVLEHHETFWLSKPTDRTLWLYDYLEKNGLEEVDDLVGHTEILTFAKKLNDFGSYFLTIIDREMVD